MWRIARSSGNAPPSAIQVPESSYGFATPLSKRAAHQALPSLPLSGEAPAIAGLQPQRMEWKGLPHPRAEGRPLVLGHRGASADAPENTLTALLLAMAQGADGVEFDVQVCRDGLVIVHDDNVFRVAGVDLEVKDASVEELQQLDVGSFMGPQFKGEKIPTLEQVLEAMPPHAVLNIELKVADPARAEELGSKVAQVLKTVKAPERIMISSFSTPALQEFRRCNENIPSAQLHDSDVTTTVGEQAALGPFSQSPGLALADRDATQSYVESCNQVDRPTYTYECQELDPVIDYANRSARFARAALSWGLTGIITNRPAVVRKAIDEALASAQSPETSRS